MFGGIPGFPPGFIIHDAEQDITTELRMDGLQGSRTSRIDSFGSRIAFISDNATSTFMPRQNDDRSLEVYFFDVQERTIRQITDWAIPLDPPFPRPNYGAAIVNLEMSADGERMVFESFIDLAPGKDTGGEDQIFLYDDRSGEMRQLTGPGTIASYCVLPSISSDAALVACQNEDGLFLIDADSGAIEQLFGPDGRPQLAKLSGDGRMLAFESFLDLDPRLGNPDHGFEIFLLDLQTREITQVTNTTDLTPSLDGIDRTGDNITGEIIEPADVPIDITAARIVRKKRQSNLAPVLEPLPDRLVLRTHRTASFVFQAEDPDGDPLAYCLQSPEGSSRMAGNPVLLIDSKVEQDGSGTATLTMSPGSGDAGDYRLRVAVFDDEGGVAIEDTDLAVISSCPSDCNGDEEVSIDEVISAVSIGLEIQPLSHCEAADTSQNGEVSIDEVLQGVGAGLSSCAPFLAGQP